MARKLSKAQRVKDIHTLTDESIGIDSFWTNAEVNYTNTYKALGAAFPNDAVDEIYYNLFVPYSEKSVIKVWDSETPFGKLAASVRKEGITTLKGMIPAKRGREVLTRELGYMEDMQKIHYSDVLAAAYAETGGFQIMESPC